MRDDLPRFHRELKIRRCISAPSLERPELRRVVECLLYLYDPELPVIRCGSNCESAHPEFHNRNPGSSLFGGLIEKLVGRNSADIPQSRNDAESEHRCAGIADAFV